MGALQRLNAWFDRIPWYVDALVCLVPALLVWVVAWVIWGSVSTLGIAAIALAVVQGVTCTTVVQLVRLARIDGPSTRQRRGRTRLVMSLSGRRVRDHVESRADRTYPLTVDDRAFFDLDSEEDLTSFQVEFLAELRVLVEGRLWPYCADFDVEMLLVALDMDAPEVALVNLGLELRGNRLRGDRISVHDRSFPPAPTVDGFAVEGTPSQLAARGCALFDTYWRRPVVKHEWLHRGRVYANSHLFEDTGERLSQMYRSDWAPRFQEARLVAKGFVRGKGWIQTEASEYLIE